MCPDAAAAMPLLWDSHIPLAKERSEELRGTNMMGTAALVVDPCMKEKEGGFAEQASEKPESQDFCAKAKPDLTNWEFPCSSGLQGTRSLQVNKSLNIIF